MLVRDGQIERGPDKGIQGTFADVCWDLGRRGERFGGTKDLDWAALDEMDSKLCVQGLPDIDWGSRWR